MNTVWWWSYSAGRLQDDTQRLLSVHVVLIDFYHSNHFNTISSSIWSIYYINYQLSVMSLILVIVIFSLTEGKLKVFVVVLVLMSCRRAQHGAVLVVYRALTVSSNYITQLPLTQTDRGCNDRRSSSSLKMFKIDRTGDRLRQQRVFPVWRNIISAPLLVVNWPGSLRTHLGKQSASPVTQQLVSGFLKTGKLAVN